MSLCPPGCKGVTLFRRGSKIDDLVDCLDANKVLFGIVKTSTESGGSFSRKSNCFVVYKGENMGQVKASKLMARKFSVERYCDEHAKLTCQVVCYEKKNMKDLVLEEIASSTIDDTEMNDVNYKLEGARGGWETKATGETAGADSAEKDPPPAVKQSAADGEKKAAAGYAADDAAHVEPSLCRTTSRLLQRQASRKFAKTEYDKACEDAVPNPDEVLQSVRDDHGRPYNWVLLKPHKSDLKVENAGGGGVVELSGWLQNNGEDKLLYGLVRVAFGLGKLRRTWLFSLHWQGSECSGVKVMLQKKECSHSMEEKMGSNSFTIGAMGPDDVMPEAVIAKLTSSVVIDGGTHDITVQALIDALEEEEEAIRQYHENKERKKKEAEDLENNRLAAEAEKEEAERLAKEAAETERLAKEEKERLAREAEAAAAAASAEGAVSTAIEEVGVGEDDAWVLFEIVI